MKSITFITSFIATLVSFSPIALGSQSAHTPEAGKHCELKNKPDNVIHIAPTQQQQVAPSGKARIASGAPQSPGNS